MAALAVYCAFTTTDALSEGKRLYYAALENKDGTLERSAAVFEALAEERPRDPVVRAYRGAARLLEAARTFAVWKKGKLAKEGLELLDGAVQQAPEQLEVRFLRAASTFHLPGWFKRRDQSRADFAFLAERVGDAARAGRLDPRLASAALFHHGVFCERGDDHDAARAAWQAAVDVAPGSHAGVDASKRLRR